jgi:hypothetical protein
MVMTRKQKEQLAFVAWSRVGNLVEIYDEYQAHDSDLRDIPFDEMLKQVQLWMLKLPGDEYDLRIGLPERGAPPPRLTRNQKQRLGLVVRGLIFDILDSFDEMASGGYADELQDMDFDDVKDCLHRWVKHIPMPTTER